MSGKTRHNADDQLIEALARGQTQTEAAQLAGCSVRTVARRLTDAGFAGRVETFRDALLEQGAARMGGLVELAATTLRQLMEATDSPPAAKLGAAKTVIDAALKLRDTLLIEKRLAALEARAANSNTSNDE